MRIVKGDFQISPNYGRIHIENAACRFLCEFFHGKKWLDFTIIKSCPKCETMWKVKKNDDCQN